MKALGKAQDRWILDLKKNMAVQVKEYVLQAPMRQQIMALKWQVKK